jgi:transposase
MWAYRSLDIAGANVFDFSVSRHRDGPQEYLKNYTGTLLGDCYSGFESLV